MTDKSWQFTGYRDALAFADGILAKPPAEPWLDRVEGVGRCIYQFALPLSLCPCMNQALEASRLGIKRRSTGKTEWVKPGEKKRKAELLGFMRIQALGQGWRSSEQPLSGRAMIRCVRISCHETDPNAGFSKSPIDRLTAKNGLGILVDDKARYCKPHEWWEPSGCRKGLVLLEVWTGEQS